MIDFTLYTANCCGDSSNCIYPNKTHITDSASFVAAIKQDHVCAAYKNNYRSNDNFLETDVLPMDCDNDHSDDPKDWIYPLDVVMAFPDVSLLVSYSRNNMKVKNGKAARPKFHVYFPIPTMTDGKAYVTETYASLPWEFHVWESVVSSAWLYLIINNPDVLFPRTLRQVYYMVKTYNIKDERP